MDLRAELQAHLGTAYTLGRELGGGGMSRVFLAEDVRLGRTVVIKVLSPELAQGLNAERFEREIRLAASLQQANIVPLLAAGELGGIPYFTMPFVEGESLRVRLARGPIPISEVVTILRDVSRALVYAHSRGVIHRDIKPDNVLLSGGAAVVTDFGIAKAISASRTGGGDSATLTQLGTSLGTPAYMAPEQVAGDPGLDQRVDLYALGCMAFELLTGQQPFGDRAPQKVLAAHLTEVAPPVASIRPDCPPALSMLVAQLMAKEPSSRPASASELLPILDNSATPGSGAMIFGGAGMLKKALGWYVLALLAVAIVAKAAVVGIGLPDWVFPGAILVMALGLPALLATAYVQRVARHTAMATPTLTPGGSSVTRAPSGTMATVALKASPHLTWQRTIRSGIIAVGAFVLVVAGFMVLRGLGIGPWGSLFASGRLGLNDQVVVAEIAVPPSDSSLGPILSEAVRAALSQSKSVRPVEPAVIADVLQLMKRPRDTRLEPIVAREVATRAGATAVLGGRLAHSGGDYAVSLDLTSAHDGSTLASVQGTASGLDGLLKVVDKLTRQLRSRIGESLKDVQHTVPLEQATTSSLQALRRFSDAVIANDVTGNYDEAVRAAREAVALDSTFALAWRKLGVALYNAGYSPLAVDSAVTRAVQYSDRLPEREKYLVLGNAYEGSSSLADRGKALASYQRVFAADSNDATALHQLAMLFERRRQFDSAVYYAERYARLKMDVRSRAFLALLLAFADQGDSAARTLDQLGTDPQSTFYATQARYFTLLAQARPDSARRLAEAAHHSGNSSLRLVSLYWLAGQTQLHGQLRASGAVDSEQVQLYSARGGYPDVHGIVEAENDIRYRGRGAEGARLLDQLVASKGWLDASPQVRPYSWIATLYALAGRPDRARDMLARSKAENPRWAAAPDSLPVFATVKGEIALAENKYEDALRLFRAAQVGPDGAPMECTACGDYNVGRVYDRMGKPDSAIAYFTSYFAEPASRRNLDYTASAAVNKRLGELYDARGDTAQAVKYYGAFVDLWKNADPDLQPVVATVKKRLGELASR